jgi:hypothetical protein
MEELRCAQCNRIVEATPNRVRSVRKGKNIFCTEISCRVNYWRAQRKGKPVAKDRVDWEAEFAAYTDPHYYDGCRFEKEWRQRYA